MNLSDIQKEKDALKREAARLDNQMKPLLAVTEMLVTYRSRLTHALMLLDFATAPKPDENTEPDAGAVPAPAQAKP